MMKPKLRLTGYEDEWQKSYFGKYGNVSMCKRIFKDQTSPQGDIPFYKIGTFGFKPDAFISRTLFEEYKAKYPYPQKGDILISAAGTIGRTVEYTGEDAYYQDSNIVWLNHNEHLDNHFLKQLYSIIQWSSLEGATIKRLYNNNILQTSFYIPEINEQKDIASFFSYLDSLITAAASTLSSIKQIKAASLQAMFPQEGETIPRLRFKGFEGEWKDYPLSDICNKNISSLSENSLGPNEGKYAVYGASGYIQQIPTYDMNAPYVGIIKDGSGVGRSQLYPAYSSLLGTMQYITPKDGFSIEFIASLFQTINFSSYINGSSIPHIYYKDYCNLIILAPSFEEQKSIGSYFTNLNCQISLLSQRLERLKQIKSACLDNMFV